MAALTCPVCETEAAPGLCAGCQALLALDGGQLRVRPQNIERAEGVVAFDFRRDALPGTQTRDAEVGTTKVEGRADGVACHVRPGVSFSLVEEPFRTRDGVITVTAVAESFGASFGLVARHVFLDDGDAHYFCEANPSTKRVRIGRRVCVGNKAAVRELLPWTHCPLAPIGASNQLSLGFQGPDLQLEVNGASFSVAHDPVLGTGHVGLRIAASGQGPATVRFTDMQVWLTRS